MEQVCSPYPARTWEHSRMVRRDTWKHRECGSMARGENADHRAQFILLWLPVSRQVGHINRNTVAS